MPSRKQKSLARAVEKVARIIEKHLATFPVSVRNAKLDAMHRIVSRASRSRRGKPSRRSETRAIHPSTRIRVKL